MRLLRALAPLWRARSCPAARVTFQGHGALILQILQSACIDSKTESRGAPPEGAILQVVMFMH